MGTSPQAAVRGQRSPRPGRRSIQIAAIILSTASSTLAGDRPIDLVPTLGTRGGAELSADVSGSEPAEADPSLSYGLAVDFGLSRETWLEALFERQTLEFSADPALFGTSEFDVHIDYLQVGSAYGPDREGLRPYITAALGLTFFSASGASVEDSTDLSGSLGGGFQAPLGRRVAFRLEGRGYASLTGGELAVVCGPGCVARFSGGGWWQLGLRTGLAIRM
jgi:hypothetical protein